MRCSKSSSKTEVYGGDTGEPQERRKLSYKQSNLIPKKNLKKTNSKVSRRREIKIIAETNEIETKIKRGSVKLRTSS